MELSVTTGALTVVGIYSLSLSLCLFFPPPPPPLFLLSLSPLS